MSNQHRAVVIRCCASDWQEAIALYDTLSALSPHVYCVYAGEKPPAYVPVQMRNHVIVLDEQWLRDHGLHASRLTLARLTWQCGDLALYAAAERIQADYLWMLEPDVYASPALFQQLFAMPLEADFHAPLMRPEHERWFWHPAARRHFEQVWACLFCVVAVRTALLPALRARRAELIAEWASQDAEPRALMNDESFVCSFLQSQGGRCVDLNATRNIYAPRSLRFGMPGSRRALQYGGDRGLLHHPVYGGLAFERKAWQRMNDHGLSYGAARHILYEQHVLPVLPGFDALLTVGYMLMGQPRASWRHCQLKLRGLQQRIVRMIRAWVPRSQGSVADGDSSA